MLNPGVGIKVMHGRLDTMPQDADGNSRADVAEAVARALRKERARKRLRLIPAKKIATEDAEFHHSALAVRVAAPLAGWLS